MTRYATFDANGAPTGFYSEDVHGPRAAPVYGPVTAATDEDPHPVAPQTGTEPNPAYPAGCVAITDDQWMEFISNQGLRRWDATAGAVVAHVPPPSSSVPQTVTNYQARAVLIERGLFDRADAALRAADMSVTTNKIALQAWDYANSFERGSPIIAAMAGVLGLAPADVDALFVAAAAVQ